MITTVLIVIISSFLHVKLYFFLRGKQFGGKIRPYHLEKYSQSSNWDGKKFNNLEETSVDVNLRTLPALLRKQLKGRSTRNPKQLIPVVPFTSDVFKHTSEESLQFIWLGHSVLLLRIGGKTLLIDPMLSPDAAPIAPVKTPRFSKHTLDIIDQLPQLDAILLTHDHYDHLDYASLSRLKGKTSTYLVALGVSRHLERWDIPAEQIKEFDWWEEIDFAGIRIIFTPSRHFSGRGPVDRAKSLWGGWVFLSKSYRIYWTGDGGYGDHFTEVGKRYGPFEWVFAECGQYNEMWHQIHMYPEECIQAIMDAKGKIGIPVHWGAFSLAMHHWKEPVERFVAAANERGQPICCPQLGEVIEAGNSAWKPWWENLE